MSLYHYTSEKGAKAIEESGQINASKIDGADAVFGQGVYLTSLSPDNTTATLVENNYDDRPNQSQQQMLAAKTEYVVEVPKETATKVSETNRDIYLHEGDLKLDGNSKIYKRDDSDDSGCTLM